MDSITLIESEYDDDDVIEVISTLIISKIRFLNQKILYCVENNLDYSHYQKRVDYLSSKLTLLSDIFESGEYLVSCDINIKNK